MTLVNLFPIYLLLNGRNSVRKGDSEVLYNVTIWQL